MGVAAQFAQLSVAANQGSDGASASGGGNVPELSTPEQTAQRREAWERGEIDYTGKDAFDNIMDKMLKTMDTNNKKPWKKTVSASNLIVQSIFFFFSKAKVCALSVQPKRSPFAPLQNEKKHQPHPAFFFIWIFKITLLIEQVWI